MSQILANAEYLTVTVLHAMFHDRRVRFPTIGRGAQLPENFRTAVSGLHATISKDAVPAARIEGSHIILPAGFFCERWCSSYRLAKIYHNRPGAFEEFESELADSETEFVWAAGVPDPMTPDNHVVSSVNKTFQPVVAATLFHEIGHALFRGQSPDKKEVELRCDRFAMDYLLGGEGPRDHEVRFLGAAIWLCCVCTESLSQRQIGGVTHPHPVDRVVPFITDYLYPHYAGHPQLMGALEMLCVVHIHNLAQRRRPEAFEYAMDEFRKRDSGDPMVMLECLKSCWTE
jgi:hypothetical protein